MLFPLGCKNYAPAIYKAFCLSPLENDEQRLVAERSHLNLRARLKAEQAQNTATTLLNSYCIGIVHEKGNYSWDSIYNNHDTASYFVRASGA